MLTSQNFARLSIFAFLWLQLCQRFGASKIIFKSNYILSRFDTIDVMFGVLREIIFHLRWWTSIEINCKITRVVLLKADKVIAQTQ